MEKSQGSQHGGRLPRRGDPPSRDSLEGHLRAEAGVAEISALSAIEGDLPVRTVTAGP